MSLYDTTYNYVETGKEMALASPVKTAFLVVCCILVIAVLIYRLFRKKAKDVTIMGPFELGTEKQRKESQKYKMLTTADQLMDTTSNNTTVSFFLYVSQVNRELIPIGKTVDEFNYEYLLILGYSMGIQVDPIHQKARITFVPAGVPNAPDTPPMDIIEIPTLYVSKWNQITITVEGRSVDIYVNGRLVTSALLTNVPWTKFSGLILNTSPDFVGQAGLFQIWPERRTMEQILENYERNVDQRGKPLIPDVPFTLWNVFEQVFKGICDTTGICGVQVKVGPMQYIDYEFA
jgi:hypothetical protein